MIEVKNPDLDVQRGISVHHNGMCLMQADRGSAGLNLKNCVLLDSESTVHAFCISNLYLGSRTSYDISWKWWNK